LPDKPTDLGITRTTCGSMTDDLDHRDLHEACGTQVQVLPTPYLDPRSFRVSAFPGLVRFPVAALILALKAVSILATGPDLTGNTYRSRAIEHPIALDAQQATRPHISQPCQKRRAGATFDRR
jgi:hypothetical protein